MSRTGPNDGKWTISHGFTAQNITLMLTTVLVAFVGYFVSTLATKGDIARLERRMDRIETRSLSNEQKLRGRTEFMTCAARQIDALMAEAGRNSPCQLPVPE